MLFQYFTLILQQVPWVTGTILLRALEEESFEPSLVLLTAMNRSSAGSYSGRYGVPGQVVCPRIFCRNHSATFLRVNSLMFINGRRKVGPGPRGWIDG